MPRSVVEDSCVLLSCLINLFSACSSCCARFAVRRKVGKAVCLQLAKDNFCFDCCSCCRWCGCCGGGILLVLAGGALVMMVVLWWLCLGDSGSVLVMMVLLWYAMVVVDGGARAGGSGGEQIESRRADEGKRSVLRCPARPRTTGIMTNDDCISWGWSLQTTWSILQSFSKASWRLAMMFTAAASKESFWTKVRKWLLKKDDFDYIEVIHILSFSCARLWCETIFMPWLWQNLPFIFMPLRWQRPVVFCHNNAKYAALLDLPLSAKTNKPRFALQPHQPNHTSPLSLAAICRIISGIGATSFFASS